MKLCDNPNIELLHGDCLDLMPSIPDKSVDMILADLPYGTTACHWDTVIPFEPLWKQYKRIIKDNGAIVLTASQPFTSALVMSNIKWFKYEMCWDKKLPTGHLNKSIMPLRVHENILIFCKTNTVYNPQLSKRNIVRIDKGSQKEVGGDGKSCYGKFRYDDKYLEFRQPLSIIISSNADKTNCQHPTQKPVKLFEYLIRTYTNEGETVLDNVAGSGTTAIACYNTNRNAILMEKDDKYFEIAKKRIENHVKQLILI